jgi:hypothetical protein
MHADLGSIVQNRLWQVVDASGTAESKASDHSSGVRAAGLVYRLSAQGSEKGPRLLPRAVVEQVVMCALGKQFDPLRLVGGAIDPPAHLHRDHRIPLAMQD